MTFELGDHLASIRMPATPIGWDEFRAGFGEVGEAVDDIAVDQLPGPMGFYYVARVRFEGTRPDVVIPLHMAERFEIRHKEAR
jgi:hypothetical protein